MRPRAQSIKYCSECGARVRRADDDGGTWAARHVCTACHTVFYQSPRLVVACMAEHEDRILLCRRGTEPGYGLWALAGGFVEAPERATEAARRELLEEANVEAEIGRLVAIFNLAFIGQVQLVFRARLLGATCTPGAETLEVRLFGREEVPWDELAFVSTRETLRHHFRTCGNGRHDVLFADITQF